MTGQKTYIPIVKNENTALADVMFDHSIASEFGFGLYNIEVSPLDEFLESLRQDYGDNLEESWFEFSKKGLTSLYIRGTGDPDFYLIATSYKPNKAMVEIYAHDPKSGEAFYNRYKKFLIEDSETVIHFETFYHEGGLKSDITSMTLDDLPDLSEDYYPDISSVDAFFDQFMKSKENILILQGETGIGKSKFATLGLKWMLKNPDKVSGVDVDDYDRSQSINVAYVKNEKILSTDSFWVSLKQKTYAMVVLDDLDYFLSPRQKNVGGELDDMINAFMSQFLSYTDGLVPTRTKFIITTNRPVGSIDEALLRYGRLFGIFRFSALPRENAKRIWLSEGLSEEDFDKEFPDMEEILQGMIGSKIHQYKKNNGVAFESFLTEGSKANVSVEYFKKRKAGLV